jgi:hypothetical protein
MVFWYFSKQLSRESANGNVSLQSVIIKFGACFVKFKSDKTDGHQSRSQDDSANKTWTVKFSVVGGGGCCCCDWWLRWSLFCRCRCWFWSGLWSCGWLSCFCCCRFCGSCCWWFNCCCCCCCCCWFFSSRSCRCRWLCSWNYKCILLLYCTLIFRWSITLQFNC